MGIRIDLAARRLFISPQALLEPSFRRIGYDRGDVRRRQWLGQAIHRHVVEEARTQRPAYQAEVPVRWTFSLEGFEVNFEGRLDGRYTDPSGTVVIEEIKSIHFAEELDLIIGSPRWERFKLQLRWYLLAVSEVEKVAVRGVLVLADVETLASQTHAVEFDAVATKASLEKRIRALITSFFEQKALADAKAIEGDTLEFPFPVPRPGQREILAAVERAAAEGEHLLIEAPTGIGKTVAALMPLLRNALSEGRKLWILTSKTTQQDIFGRTLKSVAGEAFRTLRLRAKERMCANDVVLCHENHCRFAQDYGTKLVQSGLIENLLTTRRDLTPDDIFEEARNEEICPFEVSLELVEEADVVICDYNYVFDPWIALSNVKDPHELASTLLLVDEIHNLVDRARGSYSPALSEARLSEIEGHIQASSSPAAGAMLKLADEIREFIGKECDTPEAPGPALIGISGGELDGMRLSFESVIATHMAHLKNGGERIPDDPLLELFFEFTRFHDVLRIARPDVHIRSEFDVFAETGPSGKRVAILCKDPSRQLSPVWDQAAAVVGMSATLTPPEFYRDLLGLAPDRFTEIRVPSPFPRERRMVRIATDVDTRFTKRGTSLERIAAHITRFSEACPGNVLVLFPSYRFLGEAALQMGSLPARRVMRPSARSTEIERVLVLQALRDSGPPVTLLSVTGGPFSEGVDYPGKMLLGVVVVSPSLPQVRFEQERLREYFEERFARGFEFAYVIPGMTRVIQSAGRLIRHEDDYGTVLLVCKRFLQKPYRRHLPADWFLDSPEELVSRDLFAETKQFFDTVEESE